jgi:hypothetical protein
MIWLRGGPHFLLRRIADISVLWKAAGMMAVLSATVKRKVCFPAPWTSGGSLLLVG